MCVVNISKELTALNLEHSVKIKIPLKRHGNECSPKQNALCAMAVKYSEKTYMKKF